MATYFYLGGPGLLTALPHPTQAPNVPWERRTNTRDTIGGGRLVDFAPGGRRTWDLTWEGVQSADLTLLRGFYSGHSGAGPWILLDPQETNMLTVNQSSATSADNATTGWTVAGTGGTIASQTAVYKRGPRALAWTFASATPGTSTLDCAPPQTAWYGLPVVPATTYTWSVQLKGSGTDAVVAVTPQIVWYTSAGVVVSTTSGTPVSTSASAWQQATVSAAAPATAAFGLPRLSADSATVGAGSVVNVDEPQFEAAAAASTWQPGLGVPLVSWTDMPTEYPRGSWWDVSGTLVEVG